MTTTQATTATPSAENHNEIEVVDHKSPTLDADVKKLDSSDTSTDEDEKKQTLTYANGDDTPYEHEHEKFHMRETILKIGGVEIRFNPIASLLAIVVIWSLAIWCMTSPLDANRKLIEWKARITELFTWFYIVTNPIFMVYVLWIAWRFGDIKMGGKDSKPEFDDVTYFSMLFSAGVGIGLFFSGVSEPLWHQTDNWYAKAGYHGQDEIDMYAINLTVFHWGIAGWSQYLVVGLCAGLAGFRFNLPFTLRSCLYPMIGDYAWGWLGDVTDGFTIVTTIAGVCTSLGLGSFSLAAGLKVVGAIDSDLTNDELQRVYVISVWIITLTATCSVVSGLNIGIKYLSQLGFGMGMVLLTTVFILEKTNFLLNLLVQEMGYYMQLSNWLLNFWTDAFGQLREGEGRAIDGKSAESWWQDSWTIFYIAIWVAWAAFVGLFIARISRGRTLRSVILNSFMAPFGYVMVWFCIFGGAGLRQARQALELQQLGEQYFDNSEHYLAAGSHICYDVPQEDVVVNGTVVFTNYLPGVTPVCEFDSADSNGAWFNVLMSFSYPNDLDNMYGLGKGLCWFSILSLVVYFITSSDSGSFIVDNLASNGYEGTHWTQRVFWAFTEGAAATALLAAGGNDSLRALQAASVLMGLPFTGFLVLMCQSIYKMCLFAETDAQLGVDRTLQEHYAMQKVFHTPLVGGVFNVFEFMLNGFQDHPFRSRIMPTPTSATWKNFAVATVAPFVPLYQIYSKFSPKDSQKTGNMIGAGVYAFCFVAWVLLFILMAPVSHGLRAFAWILLLLNGCILSTLRTNFRDRYNIEGNLIADYMMACLMWPQVLVQMAEEIDLLDNGREVNV